MDFGTSLSAVKSPTATLLVELLATRFISSTLAADALYGGATCAHPAATKNTRLIAVMDEKFRPDLKYLVK
jgi:hypothetical protein